MSKAYELSGVSLEAGYESVNRIKKHVAKTHRQGVFSGIGAFGAMFDLSELNYKKPLLVSGTDGVGTKLMVAIKADVHDTIGIDCVAMCVNDIVVQGAQPLYFLDYVAVGKNEPEKIEAIVKGVADGCQQAGAALIGGETAEMPDMYDLDHYDLAGFAVGVVEKDQLITGEKVKAGDVLIGLPSSGIHSNGYSLVRKILFKDNDIDLNRYEDSLGMTVKEAVLAPTKIYVKPILSLIKEIGVHGMAHITGGGFDENIPRALPKGCGVKIDKNSYPIPPVFNYLRDLGNLEEREMYNVFNMGIGMVIIVDRQDTEKAMQILKNCDEEPYIIGEVVEGEGVQLV